MCLAGKSDFGVPEVDLAVCDWNHGGAEFAFGSLAGTGGLGNEVTDTTKATLALAWGRDERGTMAEKCEAKKCSAREIFLPNIFLPSSLKWSEADS